MNYGKEDGAGCWITTNDGTVTISENMLSEYQKWAERARDGLDADANMPGFVLEMLKVIKAFREVLPNYRYHRHNADRQYDDGDLAD